MLSPISVFPLLYFGVFVATLYKALSGFIIEIYSTGAAEIIEEMPGRSNQLTVSHLLVALAFVMCAYLLVYYIRLEFFESHGKQYRIKTPCPKPLAGLEAVIRLSIVAVVTMKIISWSSYQYLFMFTALMSALLLIWYGVMLLLLKADLSVKSSPWLIAFAHLLIIFMSLASHSVYSADQPIIERIALIMLFTILVVAFLGVVVYVEGRSVIHELKSFFQNQWSEVVK